MFRFKLEFLLRYRQQKEEMAMLKLAQCVREANRFENELEDIKDRKIEIDAEVRNQTVAPISATVYNMYMDYKEHLRECGHDAACRLAEAEVQVEEQRQKLVNASVDRKVMERYKEKEKETFAEEEQRKEQDVLDELSSISYSRRDHDR
jgi:flagellar FliJ protein